jgi:hypothetical protein
MKKYPPEIIKEIYEKLPESLKNILSSDEIASQMVEVCKQESIEEKSKDLLFITTYVLMGFLSPSSFKKELIQTMQIDEEIAERIEQKIKELVFKKVEEELKILYGENINS